MEVRLCRRNRDLNANDRVVLHVEAIGKLSRDGLSPRDEVLRKIAGDDVYNHTVLLSLGKCDYLDSSGVEWLLKRHQQFEEEGGRLVVHSPPSKVMQLLRVMRMYKVLNIRADVTAAEQAATRKVEAHEHGN